ncbi:MAG: putative DNA binding domain-containing protein [Butyricicoccus sp.]|nr:putative DNA binding domain-containing protein [Butyricicoccus sp.]
MDIKGLLQYGERVTVECKKSKNDVPKSVWETYSAFANTSGGFILLGIQENMDAIDIADRFTIIGVEDADKILKNFWSTINGNKVSANILTDSNVTSVEVDGKQIVCIEVPQASYQQRPVYINDNPIKGSYKRNYEGDYHCSEEEVKAMLRDASDTGNDGGLLDGFTMEDIDPETLKAYRIEYQLKNPDHVWNNITDKDFLRNLGGYTIDRGTGKEGLTTAGLLMFGKGLSIRERFDNIRMDYIDETNLSIGSRWSDRLTYDGMWENNLYNFLKRVMPKLVSDIKRPFKLEGISRVDDTLVHTAIREAFVNLVIHSDYLITGVLKIIKKEDGFIFSNPGTLKLPIQMIYEGGNSKARNPRIQTMLRMIGLGDNIGSGFPTILNAWGSENWRKPDLSENLDLHQVELKLWMVSLMPTECTEYLNQLFGGDYDSLSADQQIILSTAYLEGEVSNNRLQSILNKHSTEIGKDLCNLVQREMLIASNRGRWTTYTLNSEYKIDLQQTSIGNLKLDEIKLNPTDRTIYDYIKENKFITTHQVTQITRINTTAGASVALNRLIDLGLIQKTHEGKQYYYKLTQ